MVLASGGLVLSTQFWNTYTQPDQKLPEDAWTVGMEIRVSLETLTDVYSQLHGLWPDFCNGSYTGYCDVSRQFDPHPYVLAATLESCLT
jgi:ribonuclease T2